MFEAGSPARSKSKPEEAQNQRAFPLGLLMVVVSLSLLLSLWTISETVLTPWRSKVEPNRAADLREVGSDVLRHEEALTGAVRLYISTGDPHWKKRIEKVRRDLTDAIAQSRALATGLDSLAYVITFASAAKELTKLQNRAIALADSSQGTRAYNLVSGQSYTNQRQFLMSGALDLRNSVHRELRDYLSDEAVRANRIAVASAIVTAILVLWCLIFYRAWTWHLAAMSKMKESRGAHRDILQGVQIPLLEIDEVDRVRFVNSSAIDYFGVTARNLKERAIHALFPSRVREELKLRLDRVRDSRRGDVWVSEGISDGQWVEIQAFPTDAGVCILVQDITARQRVDRLREENELMLEEAVRQAEEAALLIKESRDEALKLAKARAEFLANMSHEIRTPMNGVLGMLTLLESTTLDAEQDDYIATVRNCADSLLQILNDILDVSKLESGKVLIETKEFSLHSLIRELVQLMQGVATQTGVKLSFEYEESLGTTFLGDGLRIRQIVQNIVGNAVKFARGGEVHLVAQSTGRPEDHVVRISVRDNGPGIAPDRLEAIFESFAQEDSSTTRRYGGTGLGLTICRQLAELMGGKVGVTSELGVGSTFYIDIPLPRVACPVAQVEEEVVLVPVIQPAPLASSTTEVSQPAASFLALIVEDNLVNQKVATRLLAQMGYRTVVAENGRIGVELAIDASPDLVFMDIQMPEMDGWQATAEIRRLEGVLGRRVPIIAMTANVFTEDRAKCVEVGMDGFLAKPIQKEDLAKILNKYCPILVERTKAA